MEKFEPLPTGTTPETEAGRHEVLDTTPPNLSRRKFLQSAAGAALLGVTTLVSKGSLTAAESGPDSDPDLTEANSDQQLSHTAVENPESTESFASIMQDWQSFKELLTETSTTENLDFLNQTYQGANTGISFKANWDVRTAEELIRLEDELIAEGKTLLDSELGRQLVTEISSAYQEFWSAAALAQKIDDQIEQTGLPSEFTGFDDLELADGRKFSNQTMQDFIETLYEDKHWPYENVGTYHYKQQEKHKKTFTVAGSASDSSIENILTAGREQLITIYKSQRPYSEAELRKILAHEIAHHHDWVGSLRLPMHERLDFLREVTEAFQDPDHFPSSYVDVAIPIEHNAIHEEAGTEIDKPQLLYQQTTEYWATLNDRYDLYPDHMREHWPKESALIEKWRSKLTPPVPNPPETTL